MRPTGTEKGHTNCFRCEALGTDTVVLNLCNRLAEAAREVNSDAPFVAWSYSAQHVWSAEETQTSFIQKLQPGAAVLTEVKKDEILSKPGRFGKSMWDYSIDFIGSSQRALGQAELAPSPPSADRGSEDLLPKAGN